MQDTSISTLLRVALEETGAQHGSLLLSHSGEHRIAAEATRRNGSVVVVLRDTNVDESHLPESVLHYVLRTRETVIINDDTSRVTLGVRVPEHQTVSLLCMPLHYRAKLVGVLLLESKNASDAFTPRRVKILKLVASLTASTLEHSRLYKDLREREAKLRRLVDASIIGIYIVDIRGPILESNNAYLRMLGYQRADLVSNRLRWTDLTPPEWRDADKQRVERVRRDGHLQPFEKEFFRKDGTRVPVLMGVARFKNPRTQAVVFALDISRQKRAEAIALESRKIEHTRIARQTHHALLQNLQGLIFRFQAARNSMTRHPEEALRALNDAIHDGEKALDNSRYSIQHLG